MGSEVPRHAALLRDFANTLDVECGTDDIASPEALTAWLTERRLLPAGAAATPEDLTDARVLRAGLRAHFAAHHGGDAPDLPSGLGELTRRLPLRLALDAIEPRLEPLPDGAAGALAALLVAVRAALADGSWERLKLCPADDCQYAFYDPSKNRSKTWCSMRVCGNRQKTRAYRARRRAGAPGADPAVPPR